MRYFALAADYDGTVATSGTLSEEVEAALERLRSSGRRAVLVTGRTFEELSSHRPNLKLFDCLVLENGAVLYSPSTRQTIASVHPPLWNWPGSSNSAESSRFSRGRRSWRPDGCMNDWFWTLFATWALSCRSPSMATRSWSYHRG